MRHILRLALAGCMTAGLVGCNGGTDLRSDKSQKAVSQAEGNAAAVDPSVEGTVSEYAALVGGTSQFVRGYGLVIGLGENGSREVPPAIRRRLASQMNKYRVNPSASRGPVVSPDRMMDDLDTAVVVVSAVIPPGLPKGAPIDVTVEALPQTQTTDLDGGVLLTTELTRFAVRNGRTLDSQPVVLAHGPVFVNPFGDENSADPARRRTGRLIGGGILQESRNLRLVLLRPDYAMADVVQRRINERFGNNPRVANAISPSYIDITIPPEYRRNHQRFLELMMHLYVRRGPGVEERKVRDLAGDILLPAARHHDIALTWEAMGRTVLPVIRDLYAHENASAAFYASRTGARLGDTLAVEAIIRVARNGGSPHQLEAIAELGRCDQPQAKAALRELLDDSGDLVRVAAYEALTEGLSTGGMQRVDVDRQFVLDVVPTKGEFIIYASQSKSPRIALFGPAMQVRRPVFHHAPGELLTINARDGEEQVTVYRRSHGQLSDELKIPFDVQSLTLTMGRLPKRDDNGQFRGLGLTYSQVVGVLYRLCKEQAIPARFVLQRPPEASRIYAGGGSVGRPDTDEEP